MFVFTRCCPHIIHAHARIFTVLHAHIHASYSQPVLLIKFQIDAVHMKFQIDAVHIHIHTHTRAHIYTDLYIHS